MTSNQIEAPVDSICSGITLSRTEYDEQYTADADSLGDETE